MVLSSSPHTFSPSRSSISVILILVQELLKLRMVNGTWYTRFSRGVENEQADAGREPVS